ncbi:MAG TPA: TlpA disulfide reductase family protein [Actinomycetota bacterium]|nr:TlpA disulfide reductase family protein [Actinomycetota bacterium]
MVPTNELEGFRHRSRARKIVVLAAIACVLAVVVVGFLRPAKDGGAGGAVPDFELPLVNESGELSSADLKGDPVVVNFFASWCLPCREEAPLLQRTYEKYQDRGVRFVGVAIRDAASDTKDFVERYGITYPVIHDPAEAFAGPVGVLGLPETYFVDRNWTFAGESSQDEVANRQGTVWFGPIDATELERSIEAMLESR